MIKLIINADDFGLDSQVNDAVARGLLQHKITSATILANSEHLDEVLDISRQHTDASFGVHLNLTAGKSLTENSVFYDCGIMDKNGCFIMRQAFNKVPNPSEVLCEAIKEEWQAQISVIRELGIPISHIDGHHHCHTWNGLLSILQEVIKANQINKVRSVFRYPTKEDYKEKIKFFLTNVFSKSHSCFLSYEKRNNAFLRWLGESVDYKVFRESLFADGVVLTDYFCSFTQFLQLREKNLHLPKDSSIELMVHPGVPRFNKETESLFQYVFNKDKYILSSYNEL